MQSDYVDINVQDENIQSSSQATVVSSSEQRLGEALNFIEDFLTERQHQLDTHTSVNNKEVVLANLDMLISRMQDILQQVDVVE